MAPTLQNQLTRQRIEFQFNPRAAPHFGDVQEREVCSVKSALYTWLGAQTAHENIPVTVLLKVEAILNSKPLGFRWRTLSLWHQIIIMRWPNWSLTQVVYPKREDAGDI